MRFIIQDDETRAMVSEPYFTQRRITDFKPAINAIRRSKNIRYQYFNNNIVGNDYCLLTYISLYYLLDGSNGTLIYFVQTLTVW